jgi:acetoacetyl-CoA synthetase
VLEVPAIPVTVNGKKIETLVKGVICSGEVPRKVSNTVQNPGCLGAFRRFYDFDGDGGARATKL